MFSFSSTTADTAVYPNQRVTFGTDTESRLPYQLQQNWVEHPANYKFYTDPTMAPGFPNLEYAITSPEEYAKLTERAAPYLDPRRTPPAAQTLAGDFAP